MNYYVNAAAPPDEDSDEDEGEDEKSEAKAKESTDQDDIDMADEVENESEVESKAKVEIVKRKDVAKLNKAIRKLMLRPWLHPMQYYKKGATMPTGSSRGEEKRTEEILEATKDEMWRGWPRMVEFHIQKDEPADEFKGLVVDCDEGEMDSEE